MEDLRASVPSRLVNLAHVGSCSVLMVTGRRRCGQATIAALPIDSHRVTPPLATATARHTMSSKPLSPPAWGTPSQLHQSLDRMTTDSSVACEADTSVQLRA